MTPIEYYEAQQQTQNNDTEHNDIQHNFRNCKNIMQSVKFSPNMLIAMSPTRQLTKWQVDKVA